MAFSTATTLLTLLMKLQAGRRAASSSVNVNPLVAALLHLLGITAVAERADAPRPSAASAGPARAARSRRRA
ncbi:MAG: hypothetical protein MZW92_39785 [Comamonadaceae bacterium]|nr:hypothetical protein [Comamonadaceae bacterium]